MLIAWAQAFASTHIHGVLIIDILLGSTNPSISMSGSSGKDSQNTTMMPSLHFDSDTGSVSYADKAFVQSPTSYRLSFYTNPVSIVPFCSSNGVAPFSRCLLELVLSTHLGSTFSIRLLCPGREKIHHVRHPSLWHERKRGA